MTDDNLTNNKPENSEEKKKRSSNLDDLMSAKAKAEKEAQRWSEIEDKGLTVHSHDEGDSGMTRQMKPEPPIKSGDTPTGSPTPAQGIPPVSADEPPPPKADPVQPPPSFPHPTDPKAQSPPPSSPAEQPEQEDRIFFIEPTRPEPGAIDPQDQRTKPRGSHDLYEPPPDTLDTVRVDSDGMPLPRRATPEEQITPSNQDTMRHEPIRADDYYQPPPVQAPPPPTYQEQPPHRAPTDIRPSQQRMQSEPPPPPPRRKRKRRRFRITGGCLARTLILIFVGGLVSLMLGGGGAAIYYNQVTSPAFEEIDDITDLQERALQFETTRIYDRNGDLLYEINDPNGGRRNYVPLEEISPYLIHATVATEERGYFINPGFSIYAILRAVYKNYQEGRVVSGASTITQQLTRALLLPEEERTERSYSRKIKEIFLSAELGRRFTKEDVLELYLNQIYYGNLAYGIEAASQTYFDKSARDLTLAESAFLAGLPQAPAVWDPVTNRDDTLGRQRAVLSLMLEAGCLEMGDVELQVPCVTANDIAAAQPELEAMSIREFNAPAIQAVYPHWVVYVQQQLEADPRIGPSIYTSGYDVYTTIDPRIQNVAQEQATTIVAGLNDRNVHNASVIVIDPKTGAILGMVGSVDFDDVSISGQVNVSLTPQQPGSSIKPFTYLTTFEDLGWNPATVLWDVPIEYEIPGFGVYAPVNYDGLHRGPVSVRYAIANSLNIPAVLALDSVGVSSLLETLERLGLTTLGGEDNPNQYGLSLTLGAGEVYLLEWTNAYATIANNGIYHPTYAIERIEINGEIIEGYPYEVPQGEQVVDPGHAYLLQNILSDQQARIPSFGQNTPLNPTGYLAGAKTGTTNDNRDTWTMGFTTELAVGVWVGNTDNSQMPGVTGASGAAYIWRNILDAGQVWYPPQNFSRPSNLVFDQTVCADDGAEPSAYCEENSRTVTEVFMISQPPPKDNEGIYRQLQVDTFTGLIANDDCPDYVDERFYLVLPNPSQLIDVRPVIREWLTTTSRGQDWATQRGLPLDQLTGSPPEDACDQNTPRPTLEIDDPLAGSDQEGTILIRGSVDAPNFDHYIIDFGLSADPQGWGVLQGRTSRPVINGVMGQLDLSEFEDGPVTIRLIVFDTAGNSAETRITFIVANPTPTPTPTPTDKPDDTATPTPTEAADTPTPTDTPSNTPEGDTETETPSATPEE